MSDLEAQISSALDQFEENVATVTDKLKLYLHASDVDALSAEEPEDRKAVPYALSAYALSSMLFAYLRSEGKDTAVIMPELARVKTKMEQVNKSVNKTSNKTGKTNTQAESPKESSPEVKFAGKHTIFESEKAPRVKKNKKSIARVKKERETRKERSPKDKKDN